MTQDTQEMTKPHKRNVTFIHKKYTRHCSFISLMPCLSLRTGPTQDSSQQDQNTKITVLSKHIPSLLTFMKNPIHSAAYVKSTAVTHRNYFYDFLLVLCSLIIVSHSKWAIYSEGAVFKFRNYEEEKLVLGMLRNFWVGRVTIQPTKRWYDVWIKDMIPENI